MNVYEEMYGQDCGKIVAYEPTSLFFRFRKIGVMGTTMCLVKVTLVTKITFNGKMERLRKLFFRVSCGTSRKLLGRAMFLWGDSNHLLNFEVWPLPFQRRNKMLVLHMGATQLVAFNLTFYNKG